MTQSGITRIELLIATSVLAILGLITVLVLSSARAQMRDAVRLSDVRQTQVALELYYHDTSEFPVSPEYIALGWPSTRCLGVDGFVGACARAEQTYMEVVFSPPQRGLRELSQCSEASNAYCYAANEETYRIQFELEKDNAILGLSKGLNCATETGFESGACRQILLSN